jgi:hypothetical protein
VPDPHHLLALDRPDSAATAYLRVIAHTPDAVVAALRASVPAADRQAAPAPVRHE